MHRSLCYRLPLDALGSTQEGMDVPDMPRPPTTWIFYLTSWYICKKSSLSLQEGKGHLALSGMSFYS